MNLIKGFIKELKRVRWPKPSVTSSMFWKILIFLLVTAGFLIGIYYLFIAIWNGIGVGA